MTVQKWVVILGLSLLGALHPAARAAEPAASTVKLEIQAQPLRDALTEFGRQSGLQVIFVYTDIDGAITSSHLAGRYSAHAALDQLLANTSLVYEFINPRTVAIRRAEGRTEETSRPATSRALSDSTGMNSLHEGEANSPGSAPLTAQNQNTNRDSRAESGAADGSLEEVIVTAQKRRAPLQNVPLSVTAITAQDIRERGYTNFADALYAVPGVFFIDRGPGFSNIQMRGLAADESGAASTVATYFGETVTSVRTAFGGKPNPRLVDIERVEVLRGPQGTLFGANALAGVVRIVPAAPQFDRFEVHLGTRGFATAHSNDASYHAEGVVNVPLIRDRLALRLVGYKDEIAGYVDNIFAGQAAVDYSASFLAPPGTFVTPAVPAFTRQDNNARDIRGARAGLSWRATDRLRLDLTYLRQDDTLEGDSTTLPSAGAYAEPRAIDAFDPIEQSERLDIGSIVLNYDWDAVSLVSASNWTKKNRFANQDLTFVAQLNLGAPIPWLLFDRSEGKLFTQEVRVQSRGEGRLQWTAGGFYFQQSATANQFVADFSCPACLSLAFFGQNFALDFGPAKIVDHEQRSVFGDISYELVPRWTVGAGVRYLEETLTNLSPAVTGLLVGGVQPAKPPVRGNIYETNPSAYVRFAPSPDVTLYLQAARGFRSGDVNQPIPLSCQDEATALGLKQLTDPDTLWNYELGFKSRLAGGRLAINTAIYKQKWRGVQFSTLLSCGFQQGFNGGDVDGKGAELELQARLAQSWRLNLSASYNRNEFEKVAPATIAANLFAVGERVPNAPQKNGSAGVQYDFVLGGPWSGFARIDYLYVGDLRLKLGTLASQSSFHSSNVRVGVHRGDQLAVELFGNNLTDERAVVGTGRSTAGIVQTLLRPREVGVELRYSFH